MKHGWLIGERCSPLPRVDKTPSWVKTRSGIGNCGPRLSAMLSRRLYRLRRILSVFPESCWHERRGSIELERVLVVELEGGVLLLFLQHAIANY
jgi:hypothetical protein